MAVMTEREKSTQRAAATTKTSSPNPLYTPADVTVVPHPLRRPGGLRQPSSSVEPRPMGQRGSRPVRIARDLSWRNPMLVAVLLASFGVSLFCLYITAYARVNAERLELSSLRQNLKMAERREEALKAEISTNGLSVRQRATALGMIQAPPEAVEVLTADAPVSSTLSTPRIIESH